MEIFRGSEIVKQNSELAERLAQKVKLKQYEKGQKLYHQEESARGCLYLILLIYWSRSVYHQSFTRSSFASSFPLLVVDS
jgi:hypothetical protein